MPRSIFEPEHFTVGPVNCALWPSGGRHIVGYARMTAKNGQLVTHTLQSGSFGDLDGRLHRARTELVEKIVPQVLARAEQLDATETASCQ